MKGTATTTLMIFGATGDLALKKIFPALESLRREGILGDDVKILAISRREWNKKDFVTFLETSEKTGGRIYSPEFLSRLVYAQVDVEHATGYEHLKGHIEGEPVAYLSLAPHHHERAIAGLRDAGVLSRSKGKLLVEKPFGTDEKSARALNTLILDFLDESQVYRIDHYLGKETLLALMALHEKSGGLNALLSKDTVEVIKVAIFETGGIHGRGASYDGVGAFRDVGQNHLLEMLAVVAADIEGEDGPKTWQKARAEVFSHLAPPAKTCDLSRCGQYEGYLKELGVKEGSHTETAFEEITTLSGGRLKGVPLVLAAGKQMPTSEAFIEIDFKDSPDLPRKILCRVQPDQRIVVVNRDGSHEPFDIPKKRDAYANVIAAALAGRTEDFVGAEEIQALWNYADHVVGCWKKVPLEIYGETKPFLIQ